MSVATVDQSGRARLAALNDAGVSIWLDDLDRQRIVSGNLAELVADWSVTGVTTNPSIFDQALTRNAAAYAADLRECARKGMGVDDTITQLTTDDVRAACEVFRATSEQTRGLDGLVSIEVDPRLAHDTQGTIAAALQLWTIVDRPNVMIKIPATQAGLPAISAVLSRGINVNVTLIFSVERYRQVLAAYHEGLQGAAAAGLDLAQIHSVASFFVSRVDTEVDSRLAKAGAEELRGMAAVANARLAWDALQQDLRTQAWHELADQGANVQRALWASTGVKDPAYPDTLYVSSLVGSPCVNTMPEATMRAYADHGEPAANTLDGYAHNAAAIWADIAAAGVDAADVFASLEREGVQKFISSWEQLRTTVAASLRS